MNAVKAMDVVDRFFQVWSDPHATVPKDLIHDEFYSTDPGVEVGIDSATLQPLVKGTASFGVELAFYRDFYGNFTLEVLQIVAGMPTVRGSVANFEADHYRGDVEVHVITWRAEGTHPTRTFETRGGSQAPTVLEDRGVTIVRVVDDKIFAADKYWDGASHQFDRQ